MRVMKKTKKLLPLLFVAALFMQTTTATAVFISSYYHGTVYYDEPSGGSYLRGHIDFAVWDDRDEYEGINQLEAPGTGDYIYAYQIFNDDLLSNEAVAYFAILGIDEGVADSIGAEEGLYAGGIEPAPTHGYYDQTESKIVWEFKNGFIYEDQHSWMLVFSSMNDWVAGEYEIKGPFFPAPGSDTPVVPEPATIALLGIGSGLILLKRRKTPL